MAKKQTPQESGRKGGRTTAARYGRQYMRELGRKGGRAVVEAHGIEHMRAIGRKGFDATCNRHWNGDKEAFCRRLVELGLMAIDPMPENGVWQTDKREHEPW